MLRVLTAICHPGIPINIITEVLLQTTSLVVLRGYNVKNARQAEVSAADLLAL